MSPVAAHLEPQVIAKVSTLASEPAMEPNPQGDEESPDRIFSPVNGERRRPRPAGPAESPDDEPVVEQDRQNGDDGVHGRRVYRSPMHFARRRRRAAAIGKNVAGAKWRGRRKKKRAGNLACQCGG